MRLVCHYCAREGIERGAIATFHDDRGCRHVCGKHVEWLMTKGHFLDGAHHSKDCPYHGEKK